MIRNEHIQYIEAHKEDDVVQLLLKGIPFTDVSPGFIAQQISARKQLQKKLPSWVAHKQVVFPEKLNLSQSSSELTAQYKAKIIQQSRVADLTGGFGVDSVAFSKTNKHVTYVEKNEELLAMACHNFDVMQLDNILSNLTTAEEFLQTTSDFFDWIFLDPSRRDVHKNRVFQLEDCQPNALELLPFLENKCAQLLLKTSPLLDISYGIQHLKWVRKIHVLAVENEVKELLWEVDFNMPTPYPKLSAVQFSKGVETTFEICNDEATVEPSYSEALNYLYEPNAALMKLGKFHQLAKVFQLKKLHPNSHLFTSQKLVEDFPGRRFIIEKVEDFKPKVLRKEWKGKKMNIATRNFPFMAKDLMTMLKVKDGGDHYVFFTTDIHSRKKMIQCIKVH